MNLDTARQMRRLLANSEWLTRTRAFATALRSARHQPGGLLLIGTPDDEPWHFAAHLDDAARLTGQPALAPVLVRHHVPAGARPHLAVDLTRITAAVSGETLLVVAPRTLGADLLNRIDDARRRRVAIFALTTGDDNLEPIATETLVVTRSPQLAQSMLPDTAARTTGPSAPSTLLTTTFDLTEHLVSLAAAERSSIHLDRRLARIAHRLRTPSG